MSAADRCKVCDNRTRRPGIDAALTAGLSAALIARDQEATGFPITAATISRHREHFTPAPGVAHVAPRGKDFAIVVRDEAARMFDEGDLILNDKEHAPGINLGLKAQAEINKMVVKRSTLQVKVDLAILLSGGPPPPHLIGSGDEIIDGEAVEVSDAVAD